MQRIPAAILLSDCSRRVPGGRSASTKNRHERSPGYEPVLRASGNGGPEEGFVLGSSPIVRAGTTTKNTGQYGPVPVPCLYRTCTVSRGLGVGPPGKGSFWKISPWFPFRAVHDLSTAPSGQSAAANSRNHDVTPGHTERVSLSG